jgi:NTP pyrophosphatase (non-canonical NTP hydrolase)
MTSTQPTEAAADATDGVGISLDDLYYMTAHIYGQRNEERSVEATLNHFVEVCGMLTMHDRRKRRESLDVADALCKAFGWLFPLCAKLGVDSIEKLIFRKYPYVCPYCRVRPHNEAKCKNVRGTQDTVDHPGLRRLARDNESLRPRTLDDWQQMFADIYPRNIADVDSHRSTSGLFEELGELAEAVRVFSHYPKYVAGEIADVVSYLMGVANEHSLVVAMAGGEFSLEQEYYARYPGMCTQCGNPICICPPLPAATVGRLAKELDIIESEDLFALSFESLVPRAERAAQKVLDRQGGYWALLEDSSRFPFDRGEAHRLLVSLCLEAARRLPEGPVAQSFVSAAFQLNAAQARPGTGVRNEMVQEVIAMILRTAGDSPLARRELEETEVRMSSDGVFNTRTWRVLVVFASPSDRSALAYGEEAEAVRRAIVAGSERDKITVEIRLATTAAGLQQALVEQDYDILHISGHGDAAGPELQDEFGQAEVLSLERLRDLVELNRSLSCVILNSCYALSEIDRPLGPATIGMTATIQDTTAIAFASSFYSALAAGRDLVRCYKEAVVTARRAGDAGFAPVEYGLGADLPVPA